MKNRLEKWWDQERTKKILIFWKPYLWSRNTHSLPDLNPLVLPTNPHDEVQTQEEIQVKSFFYKKSTCLSLKHTEPDHFHFPESVSKQAMKSLQMPKKPALSPQDLALAVLSA